MKMPTIFNLMGYTAPDPLDKATGFKKYWIMIGVNLILTIGWLYSITYLHICSFNGFTIFHHKFSNIATMGAEVLINCFVYTLFVMTFRKASSIVAFLFIFIPWILLDLYTQAHYRCVGCDSSVALWVYPENSILMRFDTPALRCFFAMAADGILFGIVALYLSRLLAMLFYKNKPYPAKPTPQEYNNLFGQNWASDKVLKPKRDVAFWVLRLLGFSYLIYFFVLGIGLLGSSPWPDSLKKLIDSTYANPALAINTYFKISLMIILAFMAAYNKSLRFHACLALMVGHTISTIYALVFHFVGSLQATDTDFLLLSAEIDGVFVLIFIWILLKYKEDSKVFAPEKDLPIDFSVTLPLLQLLYRSLGIFFLVLCVFIVFTRICTSGEAGISAVYGFPDPMIGNTITLYSTLAFIAFLLVKRIKLRIYLFNALLVPIMFGGVVALLWILIGSSSVLIQTRQNSFVHYDWYFAFYATICLILASLLISSRQMYYKIDNTINTLSPSAAININALTSAFFDGDDKQSAYILHAIDRYAGGIRGRKRGLLNLPFALFENFLNFVYGFHPQFSAMNQEEQRYFLSRYFLRNEAERDQSFFPYLANLSYQIGISLNSMIGFANYSYINVRNNMGYVPFDARDRTQGDKPAYPPPHQKVADLPKNETDPLNFKPKTPDDYKLVAPRVTTPVKEENVPTEIDYLIIGSGAGGATAAYKLACSVKNPSQIMLIERGNRYQPLQDFQDSEIEMMNKIYKEGGLQQTKKFNFTIMQGECLGGSTVVNNAVCLRMPSEIMSAWINEFDINLSDLDAAYSQIGQEINIQKLGDDGLNMTVKSKFEGAVAKYNAQKLPNEQLTTDYPLNVNALNNNGDGNWNLGNKRMRKRSMLETYIPWAEARGVRVVSNMTAVRFTPNADGNKAEFVVLRSDNGELTKVKINKAVIVAGGVISSSHFLMRSEIPNENIGKRLSCNLAIPIVIEFDHEIKAYDGDQITLAAIDPQGRAAFETYFNCPASFSLASMPFFFEKRDKSMKKYSYLLNFGALIGSESNGSLLKKADILNGQAFNWTLGETDLSNIKYAIKTLVELGKLAGAKKVILSTKPGIELDLTNQAEIDLFMRTFDAYPLRLDDLFLGTAHPQGGNLMAGKNSIHKNIRVVDEDFKVVGFDNIFVADASLFPKSITVNPQWTIMAMSSLAVKSILKSFS